MKNPHAVALGKLGGSKGGRARAEALSAGRRREIASKAGAARARALSSSQRKEIARRAAVVRWARKPAITTAADAPAAVRRLLKTYDPSALIWTRPDDRYAIVCEILVRGDGEAKRWLRAVLPRKGVRELVRQYRGTGCSEPARRKLRKELDLTNEDLPVRPYLGLKWRRAA